MEAQRLSPREAARKAARARWGPPRVVRLDSLPPQQAAAIRAFLAVAGAEKASPVSETSEDAQETHGVGRESIPA
jgi:hypothetical protein